MPLPVAMVIQAWDPVVGGAQRQLQQLAGPLAGRDIGVTVVTRHAPGLPRTEVHETHRVLRAGAGWSSPAASVRFVAGGAARVLASRPAVVHAHDLLSASMCAGLGAMPSRVPLVAKVASVGPGGDIEVLLGRRGGQARLRWVLGHVDAFACVAPRVVDELLALGASPERCRLIPNGVDTAHFTPAAAVARDAARGLLGLPRDGPVVLSGGRLRAVKRLHILVEAAQGAGAHVVLVGEGPDAARLAAIPGVTVRPPVDDLRPYLAAADVYASASQTEGLSNAMLEAMAAGVPVAAVPASGVDGLLGEGRGAVAADASVAALESAIRWILPAEAGAAAGRLARAHVRRHHDLQDTADRLAALYAELAAGRGQVKQRGARTRARSRTGSLGTQIRRTS